MSNAWEHNMKITFHVFLFTKPYLNSYVFFANIHKILFPHFNYKIQQRILHILSLVLLTLTLLPRQ
jgi:hypothetical protein